MNAKMAPAAMASRTTTITGSSQRVALGVPSPSDTGESGGVTGAAGSGGGGGGRFSFARFKASLIKLMR